MKRALQILIVSFITNMALVQTSGATLKVDISNTVASVESWIAKTQKNAQDAVEAATEQVKQWTFLDKIKQKYEVIKARVELIQDQVNAVKDTVNTAEDAYGAAQGIVSSATDLYESEMSEIEGNINSVTSSSAVSSAKALTEIENLKKQMEERKTVLFDENNAKAKAAQENYDMLKSLRDSADNDETRAEIESQMQTAAQSQAEYEENRKQIEQEEDFLLNDSEYKSLQEQKALLESQLLEQGAEELQSLASQLAKNLFNKDEAKKQREYMKVIEENFLKEDEPINSETTARIMKHRREVLLKDINHALYVGMQKQADLNSKKEQVEKLTGNMTGTQFESSAALLSIEARIEELKILFDYVEVMLADMRLKTARNMLNQDFKLRDYDKNPAAMNLDNYIFTEDDIKSQEGQKSFLDSVKPK